MGFKRYEKVDLAKTGTQCTVLPCDDLPRLSEGSVVSVVVEFWARQFETKDGKNAVAVTCYPNAVLIEHVETYKRGEKAEGSSGPDLLSVPMEDDNLGEETSDMTRLTSSRLSP